MLLRQSVVQPTIKDESSRLRMDVPKDEEEVIKRWKESWSFYLGIEWRQLHR